MQALNDVWTLDVSGSLDRMKWEQVAISGRKRPSPRGYHTANLVQNVMIVVGGSDGQECFQDIWCLNLGTSFVLPILTRPNELDTSIWTQIKSDTLYRRLSHSSAQLDSYLFGHDGSPRPRMCSLISSSVIYCKSTRQQRRPGTRRGINGAYSVRVRAVHVEKVVGIGRVCLGLKDVLGTTLCAADMHRKSHAVHENVHVVFRFK